MTDWIIAVGSTRTPKVRAVETALGLLRSRFPGFLPGAVRIDVHSVDSGVASMPTTTLEMMTGARARAKNALALVGREGSTGAIGIGLEGGVRMEATERDADEPLAFLEAWSYTTDGARGFFGSSGAIPLPLSLSRPVVAGADLGESADRVFGRTGIAGKEGTFGVLTGGTVSREDAFVRSLMHALAPFYNSTAYQVGVATEKE
jgi:non-canonical (house-cleaning) NTP pyrophosphatase